MQSPNLVRAEPYRLLRVRGGMYGPDPYDGFGPTSSSSSHPAFIIHPGHEISSPNMITGCQSHLSVIDFKQQPGYHQKMALHTAELAVERTIPLVSTSTTISSANIPIPLPTPEHDTPYPYISPTEVIPPAPMARIPTSMGALSYQSNGEPCETLIPSLNPLLHPLPKPTYSKLPSDYFGHSGTIPKPHMAPGMHRAKSFSSTQSGGSVYRYHHPSHLLYPIRSDGSTYSSTHSGWYPPLQSGPPIPTLMNPTLPSFHTRPPMVVRPSYTIPESVQPAPYGYSDCISPLTPGYPQVRPPIPPHQAGPVRPGVIARLDRPVYRPYRPVMQPIPSPSDDDGLGLRPEYARPGAQVGLLPSTSVFSYNHSFSPPQPSSVNGNTCRPQSPSPMKTRSSSISESSVEYALATIPKSTSKPTSATSPRAGPSNIPSPPPPPSKGRPQKGRKRRTSKPGEAGPEWEAVVDAGERRKLQNKLAQRAFRARNRNLAGSANKK